MIGKTLGGRYEIIEQIGGGGMALVYKAKCKLLDRFVAIKVLKDEFVNDEEFVRKFRRESQAAASLSHPNIVNIYDVGVEKDKEKQIYYIVMEYIKGKTLKEIIKEKDALSIDSTLNYSVQIAEALKDAHKNGIVHRDIKPHNIMITEDNRVKVTDFGIARAATSSTVTTRSDVLGSVHYFSPEQARGGYTDEKSDIYSLGIVMYEMITGKLPYEGESPITVALKHVQEEIVSPREINKEIPLGLEKVILKAVEKRQADRYSNIGQMLKDLRTIKINGALSSLEDENNFESHTKIIPAVDIEDGNMTKTKKNKKKQDSGGNKGIFLGIILAFLLASVIYVAVFQLRDFFSSEEVIVPSIIGLQEEEAREKVIEKGLEFHVIDRVINEEYKSGEVISQSVDADFKVKKGWRIDVVISKGQDLISVPSFLNLSFSDAEREINNAGLKVGSSDYENSDTIPIDVVMAQYPKAGDMVESNTRINLTLSKGEEIIYVTMEKLVGMNIEDAKNKIKSLNLEIGEITPEPNEEIEKDIVTWQSYEVGSELESKTAVDLYISSGPEEAEENGEETEEGGESGEDADLVEGPITFTLIPLQDQEETKIRINKRQDGNEVEVYNKTHNRNDGDVVINLEGKTGAQFDIYYNDIYQTTMTKEN